MAFTVGQMLYASANTAVKFSILHFYLVIFPNKRFRRACYVLLVISALYWISIVLETFLLCKPVEYNWNKKINGHCTKHLREVYMSAGIINLLVDFIIIAMPMPMLIRLTLPTRKKIGLIAIFSVGAV
jgi:hypothetical protein